MLDPRSSRLAIAALALIACDAPATASPAVPSHATQSTGDIRLPDGVPFPNGIAVASDGTLYVGLITQGGIWRKRPGASWELFFPGTDQAYAGTSLRLDEARGLLWGASPDYLPGKQARSEGIFAVDVRTGKLKRWLALPDAGQGNDIALSRDGTVYLTDSRLGRVLRLRPGEQSLTIIANDPRLSGGDSPGAAGIVRTADGKIIVGNFGTGKLYVLDERATGASALEEIELPRLIENPDGMALAPDGALIVTEGAIKSGNGRVLRVTNPFATGPRQIEVLREGLTSPVNLTITADGRALVTESHIRRRVLGGPTAPGPDSFSIVEIAVRPYVVSDAR